MQFCFIGGINLSVQLSAGVCFAIFIFAFIFGLQLFIEVVRGRGDRTLLLYGVMTLWFWALAFLVWGIRIIILPNDALTLVIQPFALQWALYIGFGAFFGVFWLIRMTKPEIFEGRRAYLRILVIVGTIVFTYFAFTSAFLSGEPFEVWHGFVEDMAPNPMNPYGLGMLIASGIDLAIYVCIIPIGLYFLYMKQRRSLGSKVFIKDLIFLIGLILIFVTITLDVGLRYIDPLLVLDMVVIAVRGLMAVGFFLLWFSYRLMNLIMK
ncbi:MAG: hypothetical protein ACFE8O_10235 [Candidatus Hermodarchaeota archaeon]